MNYIKMQNHAVTLEVIVRAIVKMSLLMVVMCSLSACSNVGDYKKLKQQFKDVDLDAVAVRRVDSLYVTAPTYTQIVAAITSQSARFTPNVLLPTDVAETFQNSKETAFALGLYLADLGYVRYFERVSLCRDYLDATFCLANKLAVDENTFNQNVARLEDNIDNNQILFQIIDSLMLSGNSFLNDNEKYGLGALILSGIWTETTFIGTTTTNAHVSDSVMQQHFTLLSRINDLLNCLDDDNFITKVKSQLADLQAVSSQDTNLVDDISRIRNSFCKPMSH